MDNLTTQAAEYGYTIGADGRITTPSGKLTSAVISMKRGRIQINSVTGTRLFSGSNLSCFLERFWFAKKIGA